MFLNRGNKNRKRGREESEYRKQKRDNAQCAERRCLIAIMQALLKAFGFINVRNRCCHKKDCYVYKVRGCSDYSVISVKKHGDQQKSKQNAF